VRNLGSPLNELRQSSSDDYNKFSLPTGSGFPEDVLKMGARGFVSDAEFGLGGPKRFSCNEMKRQSGLGLRQAKVTLQQINGLVHDGIRDYLARHNAVPLLSRAAPSGGLVTSRQTFVCRSQQAAPGQDSGSHLPETGPILGFWVGMQGQREASAAGPDLPRPLPGMLGTQTIDFIQEMFRGNVCQSLSDLSETVVTNKSLA
jgi:hypothetical protein